MGMHHNRKDGLGVQVLKKQRSLIRVINSNENTSQSITDITLKLENLKGTYSTDQIFYFGKIS